MTHVSFETVFTSFYVNIFTDVPLYMHSTHVGQISVLDTRQYTVAVKSVVGRFSTGHLSLVVTLS